MVRREVVAAKAGRARGWLNDAAVALLGPLDAFVTDVKGRDLALFYLFGVPSSVHRVAGVPSPETISKAVVAAILKRVGGKGGIRLGPGRQAIETRALIS